jgi:hypothetical protein
MFAAIFKKCVVGAAASGSNPVAAGFRVQQMKNKKGASREDVPN